MQFVFVSCLSPWQPYKCITISLHVDMLPTVDWIMNPCQAIDCVLWMNALGVSVIRFAQNTQFHCCQVFLCAIEITMAPKKTNKVQVSQISEDPTQTLLTDFAGAQEVSPPPFKKAKGTAKAKAKGKGKAKGKSKSKSDKTEQPKSEARGSDNESLGSGSLDSGNESPGEASDSGFFSPQHDGPSSDDVIPFGAAAGEATQRRAKSGWEQLGMEEAGVKVLGPLCDSSEDDSPPAVTQEAIPPQPAENARRPRFRAGQGFKNKVVLASFDPRHPFAAQVSSAPEGVLDPGNPEGSARKVMENLFGHFPKPYLKKAHCSMLKLQALAAHHGYHGHLFVKLSKQNNWPRSYFSTHFPKTFSNLELNNVR